MITALVKVHPGDNSCQKYWWEGKDREMDRKNIAGGTYFSYWKRYIAEKKRSLSFLLKCVMYKKAIGGLK